MSLQSFLAELSELDIKLQLTDEGQLSISAPKDRLSEDMLDRLRKNKPKLVEWLESKSAAMVDESKKVLPVIVPDLVNLYEPFPSADLQTAFLMGDGGDMEFHVRPHYYVEQEFPELNPYRFEKALNAALYRQRKNLVVVTEDLRLQTLRTFSPVEVRVIDLRTHSNEEAEAILQKTRSLMSRQTLPIDSWPWFDCRVSLHRNGRARLHFNNNNVFSDGYGTYKLLSNALHYYHHPDQPLPDLTLSFRDCVLALAKLEDSPLGLESKRYWLDRLANLPGPVPIPLKTGMNTRTRSVLQRRESILPAKQWADFQDKARVQGLTPSNALFAAYAEVMSFWSGSRHFLLNSMITHRLPLHPEIKEVVGNFASMYPLEVDWRVPDTFAQNARRLQERIMLDLQHTHWSGVKVLQRLNQIHKTPGKAAIPFVVGSGLFMSGHDKPVAACLETPQVVLDHQFWQLTKGELWYVWDVIEDAFPEGLLSAMWECYRAFLVRLAEDESVWQSAVIKLLPVEQKLQRERVNDVATPLTDGMLHHALGSRSTHHPDKPAVVTATRTLTYGDLRTYANQLAHRLHQAGIQKQEPVALILEKGWEQVVAAFGVLVAGAAYVPIDPEWPQERIDYLLDHIGARVAFTARCSSLPLPDGVLAMQVEDGNTEFTSPMPTDTADDPLDLAYIIFTSGSTGVPKGVMIDHRGALNTVNDINRRFDVSCADVVFGISSLHFDLSVYDLFGTITAGGTLVLPEVTGSANPDAWIDAIQRERVTVWNSVPVLMQLLVDALVARKETVPTLRLVMLSGDWIPVTLPQQIRQIAPNARVVSLGGATEASIWSIHYPIDHHDSRWASIPYGRPLSNQSWHVLDESGRDCPTWVAGHLFIGGIGLAKGYWKDKDKSATAFIQHPRTGERIYRTGDLGRYLPDGNIEFLGRSDFQVKIQGFRVELGEIEQAVMAYQGVRAATVIDRATGAGKQLLAFVLLEDGASAIDEGALQEFLRSKLPRYMLPNHIEQLSSMPLTANGKLDRKALQAMAEDLQQGDKPYVAPVTEVQKQLAEIWKEVLEIDRVGIHDDFFELGGQSFAAVRLMTRISKQFGQRLPLSHLLEGRTISFLEKNLSGRPKNPSPLVRLHSGGEGTPWFFVHPAGGNVLCYRTLAKKLGRKCFGLQAPGAFDTQAPLEGIEDMASFYLTSLQKVQANGPYLIGGWSSGGVIAFEMARQLESQGKQVLQLALIDTPAPMLHHAVSDATLLRWFLADLDIGIDLALLKIDDVSEANLSTLTELFDQIARQQKLAININPKQLEGILQVFTRVVRASLNYRAPEKVTADITVFRATQGEVSEFADHPRRGAPNWGWSAFTSGRIRCVDVHATHYTILNDCNAFTVGSVLADLDSTELPA